MSGGGPAPVYLAHAVAPSYPAALARVRLVEAGLSLLYPGHRWARALGHTPDDQPGQGGCPAPATLQTLALRLILGDRRTSSHAVAHGCHERAAAVWLVGPADDPVRAQLAAASEAEIPVLLWPPEEQEAALRVGLIGEAVRLGVGIAREPRLGVERPLFREPVAVVEALFEGAESVLGARGLPMQPRVQSGTNYDGWRARIETVGLRIAAAHAVMVEVRRRIPWSERQELVLELVGREGQPFSRVAAATGYADGMGAWRCWQRILGAIAEVLRERRERANNAATAAHE